MNRIEEALKRAGLSPVAANGEPSSMPASSLDTFTSVAMDGVPSPDPVPTPAPVPTGNGPGLLFDEQFDEKIVVGQGIAPVPVEQYRRLAAALHHLQGSRQVKVAMVASALAGEGKTLTATNLALTLSESYKRRVLLVDADLRRPMLHEVFRVPNVTGLTDGLAGSADRPLTVVRVTPRLSLLPAGRAARDPMGALTSDRMRRLLDEASTRFDWVILDTPPVGLLPDANLLAAMIDVAVFVVAAGKTPFALAQKAIDAIGRDRVVGVVLNRADETAMPAGQYAHYYHANPPAASRAAAPGDAVGAATAAETG